MGRLWVNDANGNIETVERFDQAGVQYDDLHYHYEKSGTQLLRNRLYHLNESIDGGYGDIGVDATTFHPAHADVNQLNNYEYDELGNLIADKREEIANIEWTVSGKVKHITRTVGSTKPELWFAYGADGQRISKTVGDPLNGGYREWYLRDAQGNIMAIYRHTNTGPKSLKVTDRPVYGSSRLGSYALAQEVMVSSLVDYPFTQLLSDVHKRYELTDHLGNVNTVVSGRLLDGAGAGSPKQAEVITASGYEPFGALLPGRNWRQPLGPPPPPVTPQGTLVITEFSNGPSQANGSANGECEYVELYVTNCALYPDATEVDIRGWIVDDNAGNFNASGCGTGASISSGHLRFANVPAWANVPVGTVIVLYNGADPCYGFTANETGTGGQYFINVGSTTLLERTTTRPTTTDCDYCGAVYAAPGSSPWNTVAMGNTADAIQVRCPDCPASEAGFFHGMAYGTGFGGLTAGGHDLGGAYVSGPGSARSYELTGAGAPGDGANWTRSTAPNGGTAPASAGVVDASVIAWLEGASLACCGSFEAPVLAQKEGYRFGFNGKEKDDEVYGSEGTSYDFGARIYDPRVGRWLSLDPLASKYPSDSPYEFALSTPIQAKDPDGQVVVFINGNHFGDGGRAQYWRTYERELVGYEQRGTHDFPFYRSRETYAFDKEVMNQFNDFKAIYRDGASGGWAPLNGMSVQGRRNEGYWQAGRDAKALLENLDAGETIKIVSHSMGGAYAKGYVSGLKAYMEEHGITDVKIELEVDFAPYQPDAHENSAFGSRDPHEAGRGSVPTFQASHANDGVAGNKPMRGAEQLDTSGDTKQGHSIFNFSSTVKKLGETLSKVREQKQ